MEYAISDPFLLGSFYEEVEKKKQTTGWFWGSLFTSKPVAPEAPVSLSSVPKKTLS